METAILRQRAALLSTIRSFFGSRGYTEVDTPLLAPALIPEPSIEVIPATLIRRDGSKGTLYLVPSPELWMKRMLAQGSGSIFQLCHCFRNMEQVGPQHAVEFTMLEWYTVGHSYLESLEQTRELLAACGLAGSGGQATVVSMRELFRNHAGVDLDALDDLETMREAARSRGLDAAASDTWEECFNRIFVALVEPHLAPLGEVYVTDYPARVPTLACRAPGGRYAQRWELYLGGVEVANCFTEETDPEVLRSTFAHEGARKRHALVPHPPDTDLLEFRIPPCSGVALGVDRLLAVLAGAASVQQVILFPRSGIL